MALARQRIEAAGVVDGGAVAFAGGDQAGTAAEPGARFALPDAAVPVASAPPVLHELGAFKVAVDNLVVAEHFALAVGHIALGDMSGAAAEPGDYILDFRCYKVLRENGSAACILYNDVVDKHLRLERRVHIHAQGPAQFGGVFVGAVLPALGGREAHALMLPCHGLGDRGCARIPDAALPFQVGQYFHALDIGDDVVFHCVCLVGVQLRAHIVRGVAVACRGFKRHKAAVLAGVQLEQVVVGPLDFGLGDRLAVVL